MDGKKFKTLIHSSDETIMAIRRRVDKLTKGCRCKKNMCMTQQCGCRQKGLTCGPGCQCLNCKCPSTSTKCTPRNIFTHTLYFKNEMEWSLLIGEEVELKNDSESSDTDTDSDTDTVSSNNSDSADDM